MKEGWCWDGSKWMLRCCDSLFFRTDAPISFLEAAIAQKVLILSESKLFLFVRDLEMSVLSLDIRNSKPGNAGN